jgi:hypothetical protein
LDATVSNWRNETGTPREYAPGAASGYLSTYPKYDNTCEVIGDSDITFDAVAKTISRTAGDFSAFTVGDEFYVSGTTLNDGYFTAAIVSTTSITTSIAPVGEASTSATIRKVRDTLLMTVSRLPTARFAVIDIENAVPITEIRDDHIDGLTDGIAKRAFLKPDTYTYFPQKAEYHKKEFEEFKKEVRRDMILLNKPDKTRVPRSGTSIYY